jgi:hypothetical protein
MLKAEQCRILARKIFHRTEILREIFSGCRLKRVARRVSSVEDVTVAKAVHCAADLSPKQTDSEANRDLQLRMFFSYESMAARTEADDEGGEI